MKKFYLILGNITFHHFEKEELKLFKTDNEEKALIHDVVTFEAFDNENKAIERGEDELGGCCDSYVIDGIFKGEIVFENPADEMLFKQWKNGKTLFPFAISTSDGHSEDWSYYSNESEMLKAFEDLKHNESDIHVYILNEKTEYEVIDSFWIGDYICPECNGEEVYYTGNEKMMCECGYKGELFEFKK